MADYDLGTAHGKIRVDYEDKGFKAADKDMSSLSDRAKAMAETVGKVKQRWGKDFTAMTDNTTKFVSIFGSLVGAVALSVGTFSRAGQSLQTLGGAGEIVKSLGLAMGSVPEGAENFPSVIKRVIQMAAAIALFRGSMFLLAGLAGRFRALRFASPLLRGLGSSIFALSGPLQLVSGLALDVAFAIREFRLVKQISKWVVGATGAIAGLGGAIKIITGLADAVRQLSGLIGFLPGIVLAAGIAFGAAKIAFSGFMDAIKSGDLSKISKEAGVAVTAIRSFAGQWNELKMAVQDEFFRGLGNQIKEVGGILMPILKKGLVGVAGALRGAAEQALGFFKGAQAQRDLQVALGFTKTIVENLAKAVGPLLQVFMDVAIVGLGLLTDMTSGAGGAAQGFADMVREARETGRLADWLRNGVQGLKDLWGFATAVGRVLGTIFRGLNGGESSSFLATLRGGAEALERFLNSAKGQDALATLSHFIEQAEKNIRLLADAFVTHVLPAIKAFLPVLQAVSDAVVGGLVTGIGNIAPLFVAMGTALGPIAPILGFILKGMVATAVAIMGLFLAFKILAGVFLIINSGLRAVRGALAVAGFAFRLFTGTLRGGELWLLRFLRALIASIFRGIGTWIAGIARGIAANVRWVASTIWTTITTVARWIWAKTVLVATWIRMQVVAAATAIRTAVVWVAQTIAATVRIVALWMAARVRILASWIWLQVQAALSAARIALAWVVSTLVTTARIVGAWLAARIALVAGWVVLQVQAGLAALRIGLAWVASTIASTARIVAIWITTRASLLAGWIVLQVQAALAALRVGLAWITSTITSTASVVAAWVTARISLIAGWIMLQAAALGAAIRTAAIWISTQIPAIATVVAAWIGARIALIAGWIMMAAGALASAASVAAAWFIALGPVGWAIAAIIAVIAVVVFFWNDLKGYFQAGAAWLAGAWANITGIFQGAMDQARAIFGQFAGIIDFVTAPLQIAMTVIETIINLIVALFSGNFDQIGSILSAAGQKILSIIGNAMSGLASAVGAGLATVGRFFAELPGKIGGFLSSLPGMLLKVGQDMVAGIMRGLASIGNRIGNFLMEKARAALSSVMSFFGIASPSKVFIWIGKMIGDGWFKGLRSMKDKVASEAGSMAEGVKTAIVGPVAAAQEVLAGMAKGMRVFEDFTFRGMSQNLGNYNEELMAAMRASGIKDPKVFLEQYVRSSGNKATPIAAPTPKWNPYAKASGGDGAQAPIDMSNMSVTIDAQSVAEMNSVVEFFDKVEQAARAGKAS